MSITRPVARMIAIGLTALGAGTTAAQDYPNKPVRVVTVSPGGIGDFSARLISQGLTVSLGQPVIVENRVIPEEIVAKALPDGYTLLALGNSFWVAPFLGNKISYDVEQDFSPITMVASSPNILVLSLTLPVNSVRELIALAKTKPGVLNYASGGSGSSPHLAAELFKAMAGVDIVHVPYKGAGPGLIALIGGQVQLMFPSLGAVGPHITSGKLKALAVTSLQPSALTPELPTMAASGLPGYESGTIQGLFAPARTPATLIGRLNREVVKVLNRSDVKEKFFNAKVEVIASSPKEFAATVRSEKARLGKVIKDAGIKGD